MELQPPTFGVAYVAGCKASVARHMFLFLYGQLCSLFLAASPYAIYPSHATWKPFASSRTRLSRLLSKANLNTLVDARVDSLGVPQERLYIREKDLGKHSWMATRRRAECPLCGVCLADRWHYVGE